MLAGRTAAEWVRLLNEAVVPCGPVLDVRQVFADPQVCHMGLRTAVSEGVSHAAGLAESFRRGQAG